MTFAAPLFVWAASAAAALTVVLHLLAWRRPPETPLPTARFAPDAPVRTVSRALRPSDLALLVLRVALILLVGTALGRPVLRSRQPGLGRVVVVDASRGPRVAEAVATLARSQFRPGDVLVRFDSSATEVPHATPDSITVSSASRGTGSLSAALVAAIRVARRMARDRDSVEIVVVSPTDADELDAATAAIRRRWHGPVRVARVEPPAPNDSAITGRLDVRAASDDPVAVALMRSSPERLGADVRLVRDGPNGSDSAWASQGRALVVWPSSPDAAGWARRPRPDTAYAVATDGGTAYESVARAAATVVSPFERSVAPPPGRVVARWQDGEPAATEVALGSGCVRAVAITVPAIGDVALTPAFRRLADRLTAPCAAAEGVVPLPDRVLASAIPAIIASGSDGGAGGDAAPPVSRLTVWLLAAAIAAAVAELAVRRGAHATA